MGMTWPLVPGPGKEPSSWPPVNISVVVVGSTSVTRTSTFLNLFPLLAWLHITTRATSIGKSNFKASQGATSKFVTHINPVIFPLIQLAAPSMLLDSLDKKAPLGFKGKVSEENIKLDKQFACP
jgi:hypothetical protein